MGFDDGFALTADWLTGNTATADNAFIPVQDATEDQGNAYVGQGGGSNMGPMMPGVPGQPSPLSPNPSPMQVAPDTPVAPTLPNVAAAPQPPFDPAEMKENLVVWAHDDTLQPGKTYRYKIQYKLKNPVLGVVKAVTNPKLADQFALVSPDSPWSDLVKVPARINVYLASSPSPKTNTVKFDVYKWENGGFKLKQISANSGEAIGDGTFSTGFTLIDVRGEANDTSVVLADDEGALVRHRWSIDQHDLKMQRLHEQATAVK